MLELARKLFILGRRRGNCLRRSLFYNSGRGRNILNLWQSTCPKIIVNNYVKIS